MIFNLPFLKTRFLQIILIILVSFIFFGSFNLQILAQSSQANTQISQVSNSQIQTNSALNSVQQNEQNIQNEQTNQQISPINNSYEFYQVKVITILGENKPEISLVGANSLTQKLKAIIIDKNQEIELEYSVINAIKEQNKIKVGDNLIVSEGFNGEKKVYNVIGFYRINSLILIILVFFILTILIAGFKGLMAFVGLLLSILGIAWWLVPSIIGGFSPFLACILMAIFLAFVNLYLAHGVKTRTSIALVSVLLTLAISAFLAPISTTLVKLFGVASDEAFYLQAWEGGKLDLQGLFLGGIIIGTLGVLDDVATAQAATVEEIAKANPSLTLWNLYQSGMSVGREHILSMINTLALAYVGVSLPMILSFVIVKGQPWWAILSSDLITEEIVRTLVGSICLIIAVPICNFLASVVFCKNSKFSSFGKFVNWQKSNKKSDKPVFLDKNLDDISVFHFDQNSSKNLANNLSNIPKINDKATKLNQKTIFQDGINKVMNFGNQKNQNIKHRIMNLENKIENQINKTD